MDEEIIIKYIIDGQTLEGLGDVARAKSNETGTLSIARMKQIFSGLVSEGELCSEVDDVLDSIVSQYNLSISLDKGNWDTTLNNISVVCDRIEPGLGNTFRVVRTSANNITNVSEMASYFGYTNQRVFEVFSKDGASMNNEVQSLHISTGRDAYAIRRRDGVLSLVAANSAYAAYVPQNKEYYVYEVI